MGWRWGQDQAPAWLRLLGRPPGQGGETHHLSMVEPLLLLPRGYKGPAPQKTAFTSDSSHKFGGPQATLTSDQLAVNLGVPTTPSDLVIHQTQLKKVLYL